MNFKSMVPFGRFSPLARTGAETDPFLSLRREIDRMFDDFAGGWSRPSLAESGFLSPKVDVAETDKGLEITAELPGVDQKDIEIELADGVLTLKAEHKTEKEDSDDKKRYHVIERSSGTFLRRFALPFAAEPEKVEATFDKGVLKIAIPRSPEAEKKIRKIEVKPAA